MNYGLIGEKLLHSYSKTIHLFYGNTSYELLEISSKELDSFLRAAEFSGINVTIPYKQAVMPYCVLSEEAKRIGSVNTIVNRGNILYGYNSDYFGFQYMVQKSGIEFRDMKVIVLGSGGTSKTVLCVLKDIGVEDIIIISRSGEDNYKNIQNHYDSHIIINTTPVGMYPENDATPIDISEFKQLTAVFDVIYNPLKTRLLLDAQKIGINFMNGLSMLVAQAWHSHKLFFDHKNKSMEDAKSIGEVLQKTERFYRNIILIGMPGCGKTTIGRELAHRLGMPFIDTDHEIEKQTGRLVPDIINEDGEDYFRKIECDVIKLITKKAGQVIATGGGSVTIPSSGDALVQNGVVLFLDRKLSELSTDNRPLSMNMDALKNLYDRRKSIYNVLCDNKITVEGNLDINISKILDLIK